jgi:hypothetical protein
MSSTLIEETYSNPRESQQWVDIVLHEITHALVFMPAEYEKYRDE